MENLFIFYLPYTCFIAPDKVPYFFNLKVLIFFLISPQKHMLWYSLDIMKTCLFSPPKNENFQIKNSDIFRISAQNIDCWVFVCTHNLCFWAEIWKVMYTHVNPSFTLQKWVFVCVEVLRPSQPNGVMSSAVSLPNHTFTGQAQSSKRLTSIVHILSPETDNCPSWISGRERMTVENISWSISTNECCRPRRGLNPRPPGLQSDGASNWATEAGKSGV